MESFAAVLQPVFLMSGVALLLMSTTARFGLLETEVEKTAGQSDSASQKLLQHLVQRARKYRLALTSLYAGAAILAGATVLGGGLSLFSPLAVMVTQILTCLAVICVFIALIALLLESRMAIEAVEHTALSRPLE